VETIARICAVIAWQRKQSDYPSVRKSHGILDGRARHHVKVVLNNLERDVGREPGRGGTEYIQRILSFRLAPEIASVNGFPKSAQLL
jgi:hypothetical protein